MAAERLPERKEECVEARGEVLRLARAFAALPAGPSQVTIDAANDLSHAAGDLWSKLHWLADWTRELCEVKGGSAPAKTIRDDLANVIDLERRRDERRDT
ncbi:MAG: hypothetical protein ACJ79M_09740 [Myxococcales bacterium]